MYSHRNGETELPTEAGRYWFQGIAGGERYEGTNLVGEALAGNLCAEGPGESLYDDVKNWTGQWWGPIVAPWDSQPSPSAGQPQADMERVLDGKYDVIAPFSGGSYTLEMSDNQRSFDTYIETERGHKSCHGSAWIPSGWQLMRPRPQGQEAQL